MDIDSLKKAAEMIGLVRIMSVRVCGDRSYISSAI